MTLLESELTIYTAALMQYSSLPHSEHELVSLRLIQKADLVDWYGYLSQQVVFEHTSWNLVSSADLLGFVAGAEPPSPNSSLRFAISDRASNKLVGTIGFHSVWSPDKRAELAYDLAPSMWGKGIATYMVELMAGWAHARAGMDRVQATVLPSNRRSIAVLQRAGFSFEGTLRHYRPVRGVPSDFHIYSHIAKESLGRNTNH